MVPCNKCGKKFEPYIWSEECGSCRGDGEYEYEMEYEYEPTSHECPFCKGHGAFTFEEKNTCKDCKEESYGSEDDY
jgi:DnaJ-class molecular chaperone